MSIKPKKLHIANANFELTYELNFSKDLKSSFYLHPSFLQFQFLPLLYAKEGDFVLVSDLPSSSYQKKIEKLRGFCPKLVLMDSSLDEPYDIEPWGHHPLIEKWAQKKGLSYVMPPSPFMRSIASKEFTFHHAPKLKGARLIQKTGDVDFSSLPIVLKASLGFSGRGHIVLHQEKTLPPLKGIFVQEPWVDVEQNFSSQYFVSQSEILCLGTTLIENTKQGSYLSTHVGPLNINSSFIDEHHAISLPLLSLLQTEGFFGNIGVDAFVYKENCKSVLHPIVEINPRKTMSYVALKFLQGQEGILRVTKLVNSTSNLLPDHLHCKDKTFHFKRGLTVTHADDRNQRSISRDCGQ